MNTFVDKFLENVQKFPDKAAVMDIRGAYSYRELNQRSGFLASEILRTTDSKNSRIAILLPRTKEYMTALIAVIRSGCAAVPVDSEYPEERIQSVLKDSGCAVCITTSELSRKAENFPVIIAEEVLRDVPPGEYTLNLSDASKEGLLIYTSGSTGKPKGVIHRQSIFSAGCETLKEYYSFTENDIICGMGGFTFIEALTGGNAATYTLPYLMKAQEGISAERIISAVNAVISAHPSMKYIIRAGADRIPHIFMTPDAPVEIPIVDGKSEDRLDFMKRFVPVVAMTDEMLFHFAVYRTPECCYLAMKVHLIFFDASAISLFISELNRRCQERLSLMRKSQYSRRP